MAVLLLVALSDCGGSRPRAPVEDRHGPPKTVADSSSYRVQRGDTLYSIAFRYGLDYREVAAANGIPAPYTIYPGQRIYLREAPPRSAATSSKPPAAPTGTAPAPRTTSTAAASSGASKATPTATTTVTPVPVPAPAAAGKPAPSTPVEQAPAKPEVFTGRTVSSWRWPTVGRVSRRYSASVHKGIDIAGERGDDIVAVADGKVVYAGTGIVGFGELLIIKHNDVYLSAYGHNARLLVREDQLVRAGQKIAEKGSTGTDTVKLHFEIRKEGKPIDPLKLLPAR